jgi:FtsH-binding integral membrane protein
MESKVTTHQQEGFRVKNNTAIYMTRVYNWMALALFITGLMAYYAATSEQIRNLIFGSSFVFYGLIIGELLLVVYLSRSIQKISQNTAILMFLLYAVLNGLTMSVIFMMYTTASIASTFYITAGTFGVMSLYGYYTKNDLTKLGNLAMMGLVGIIIASIVNIFFQNDMMGWIITYLGVAIFVGLTAYDTQKLKEIGANGFKNGESMEKIAIMGALTLYLDFINLFLFLLRIFGDRR